MSALANCLARFGACNRRGLVLSCLFCALAAGANAQSGDPTRPPPELIPGAAASEAASAPPAPPPLSLQGVKIGPGQQPTALIDGKVVRVGDSVREGRVIKITENGVLLHPSSGPESWLRLLPAGSKKQAGLEKK